MLLCSLFSTTDKHMLSKLMEIVTKSIKTQANSKGKLYINL